jgi:hypothetical protein
MKRLVLTALLLCMALPAFAQTESYVELLRSDIKTQKVAILTEALQLSDEQGAIVWPMYREYLVERDQLVDTRLALIREYAEVFDQMTDELAGDLMGRSFKINEQEMKLEKKWFKKMSKEVGAATAAKLFQVENQVNLLLRLQLAANLPLLEKVDLPAAEGN